MIFHNIEECQKWIVRRVYYPLSTTVSLFEVKPDETNKHYITWHIADIGGKSFHHNKERIMNNIDIILNNYPQLKSVVDQLHIFMCPKPSADTCNACANGDYICYFARSTQIPWYMTDYITGHELGHCVQFKLCSRYINKNDRFKEYLELRNAPKDMCHIYTDREDEDGEEIYDDRIDFLYLYGTKEEKKEYHGDWDDSPQEWFAEDFRYLFGADQREKYWGLTIDPPDERIREFMLSL